ncbi:MAG: hypothetical protein K9L28_08565, partial [Synergistales bacterium]|nr:hypothetical protein [Synergistales bacterium]
PAGLSCLLPEVAFHPLAEDLSRRLGRQAPLVVTELRRLSRGTQQRILEALDHEGHHISPRG